jgi:hypothetical protein
MLIPPKQFAYENHHLELQYGFQEKSQLYPGPQAGYTDCSGV